MIHFGLRVTLRCLFFASVLCLGACAQESRKQTPTSNIKAEQISVLPAGKSDFIFSGWQGPEINVWIYIPANVSPETQVLFVMHGTKRDGDRYRDEWADLAEDNGFLLVVPEFPREKFKGSKGYNLGNVFDSSGRVNPREQWVFSVIEPLFEEIQRLSGNTQAGYSIYGHSAGSQFVHRFLYFIPEARVINAIAANAGWYTMPSLEQDFPYGLAGSPIDEKHLDAALAKNVVVLLGTADNDPHHSSLRRTPEAMKQGPHRFARGRSFFKAAASYAKTNNLPFNWKIGYAPGVGHKNGLMAKYAATLLTQTETLEQTGKPSKP